MEVIKTKIALARMGASKCIAFWNDNASGRAKSSTNFILVMCNSYKNLSRANIFVENLLILLLLVNFPLNQICFAALCNTPNLHIPTNWNFENYIEEIYYTSDAETITVKRIKQFSALKWFYKIQNESNWFVQYSILCFLQYTATRLSVRQQLPICLL